MLLLLLVFLRWFPCHGDRLPLRRDSHARGSRNQTPAFVVFDALQVDKRTDEGGGGGEGGREGGLGVHRGGEAGASPIFGFSSFLSAQAGR